MGAKAEVLASLVRLANEGTSIIVTSSELEEVLAICDRLLVFAEGEVVAEVQRGDPGFTVESVVRQGFRNVEEHP